MDLEARASSDAGDRRRDNPRRRLWATLVVIVLLAAGGAFLLWRPQGPKQTTKRTVRTTVASFSGTKDETTRSFRVTEGWRVDWKHTGEQFSFAVTGDRDFGIVISERKPGQGITNLVGSGMFRLVIKANGPWSVRILQPK